MPSCGKHRHLGARGRAPRDVQGTDQAADGDAVGGVLVQVQRGLLVAADLAALLPARRAGPRRPRYGRAKARTEAGSPIRLGARVSAAEGQEPERPRDVRWGDHGVGVHRSIVGCLPRPIPEEVRVLGTSRESPVRGLRPGDARPRRRRLRRRRRGPGRARAPGRGARGRDAAGVHHQQRLPPARAGRRAPARARRRGAATTTSSPPPRRRPGCWPSGSAPARAWSASAPTACDEALRDAGLTPVGADDDAVAIVTGYGPDVRWARHHAGGGPDPRRAAVGGQQHRPDDPDGVRGRARATASRWRCCAGSPGSTRWSPASRSGRCSTRPCAASAGAGR